MLVAQMNCTALISVYGGLIQEIRQQDETLNVLYIPLKIMFKVENWAEYWPTGSPH